MESADGWPRTPSPFATVRQAAILVLALKSNPNALECLFTPLRETVTPLAEELFAMREAFLSHLVYQT